MVVSWHLRLQVQWQDLMQGAQILKGQKSKFSTFYPFKYTYILSVGVLSSMLTATLPSASWAMDSSLTVTTRSLGLMPALAMAARQAKRAITAAKVFMAVDV